MKFANIMGSLKGSISTNPIGCRNCKAVQMGHLPNSDNGQMSKFQLKKDRHKVMSISVFKKRLITLFTTTIPLRISFFWSCEQWRWRSTPRWFHHLSLMADATFVQPSSNEVYQLNCNLYYSFNEQRAFVCCVFGENYGSRATVLLRYRLQLCGLIHSLYSSVRSNYLGQILHKTTWMCLYTETAS